MIRSHSNKNNDNRANLVLFGGGTSILSLGVVTIVKYYGIKENDAQTVGTSNNFIEIIGDLISD